MKSRSAGYVILFLGLYLLVISTFILVTEGGVAHVFEDYPPPYGARQFVEIHPRYLIYTFPLGYALSIIGLIIISRPKYGTRFWIATITLSISLLLILG